jgi:polysaccharide biosynthesis/export protein
MMYPRKVAYTSLITGFSWILLSNSISIDVARAQALKQSLGSSIYGNGINTTAMPYQNDYRLGPGDRLYLNILNLPDYSRDYQVLPDGSLALPLIGRIFVTDATLDQAQQQITARYAQFVKNPLVSLDLVAVRPFQIAVTGAVERPGTYVVSPEEAITGPTVSQAIKLAGGINTFADIRQIEIRRTVGVGNTAGAVVRVNLWQLLESGDLSQDMPLRNGDTIVVPMATAIEPTESRLLTSASFAPSSIRVNVMGEIHQPGVLEVAPNTSLAQVLLMAGGTHQDATPSSLFPGAAPALPQVRLVRLNPDGSVEERTFSVDPSQGINEAANPPLRHHDTVVVLPSSMVVNVVGGVENPGRLNVSPDITLNQALILAGGFTQEAVDTQVDLIRLNADGTVSHQSIAVNFAQSPDEAINPLLQPNDTIIVDREAQVQRGGFLSNYGIFLTPFLNMLF